MPLAQSVIESVTRIGQTLREYALLVRLHRPIGIWLLLWPTLWALWIAAAGHPPERLFADLLRGYGAHALGGLRRQ